MSGWLCCWFWGSGSGCVGVGVGVGFGERVRGRSRHTLPVCACRLTPGHVVIVRMFPEKLGQDGRIVVDRLHLDFV